VKDFLSCEDGKITKQSAFTLGTFLVGGAILQSNDVEGLGVYHSAPHSVDRGKLYVGAEYSKLHANHENHTTHSTHSTHSNCSGVRAYEIHYNPSWYFKYYDGSFTIYGDAYSEYVEKIIYYRQHGTYAYDTRSAVTEDIYNKDYTTRAYAVVSNSDIDCNSYWVDDTEIEYPSPHSSHASHGSHGTHNSHASHGSGW